MLIWNQETCYVKPLLAWAYIRVVTRWRVARPNLRPLSNAKKGKSISKSVFLGPKRRWSMQIHADRCCRHSTQNVKRLVKNSHFFVILFCVGFRCLIVTLLTTKSYRCKYLIEKYLKQHRSLWHARGRGFDSLRLQCPISLFASMLQLLALYAHCFVPSPASPVRPRHCSSESRVTVTPVVFSQIW